MVNQQLLDYVQSQFAQHKTQSEIEAELVKSGWAQADINQAFSQLTGGQPPLGTVESKPKSNKKTCLIIGLVAGLGCLVVVGVIGIFGAGLLLAINPKDMLEKAKTASSTAKQDLIEKTVEEVKAELGVPKALDDMTTIVDITAEPGAIRYHYELTGVDAAPVNEEELKENLINEICGDSDTMKLLELDIGMEFSYTVVDTDQSYFVTVAKDDCQ